MLLPELVCPLPLRATVVEPDLECVADAACVERCVLLADLEAFVPFPDFFDAPAVLPLAACDFVLLTVFEAAEEVCAIAERIETPAQISATAQLALSHFRIVGLCLRKQ